MRRPARRTCVPYLKVTALLEALGAHVPHVHEADVARGLLLLEDLGTTPYLPRLEAGQDAERLYGDALDALADIQVRGAAGARAARALRPRGARARDRPMPEWFCAVTWRLTDGRRAADDRRAFEFLIRRRWRSRAVFVHRDYHSRNLMVVRANNPGIIDFQDALAGRWATIWYRFSRTATSPGRACASIGWVRALSRAAAARGRAGGRERGAVPALVRSHRRAASPQGARHLLPAVVSRRQGRLSAGPAAHLRICARCLCALRGACPARAVPRSARGA